MQGIGASPGIAIGKVFIKKENIAVPKRTIQDTVAEKSRLSAALKEAISQLEQLASKTEAGIGKTESEIFLAQRMMASDEEFIASIHSIIETEQINAEAAVEQAGKQLQDEFALIEDEYFKERISDIRDVSRRIISNLLGVETLLLELKEKGLIAARDLTPSDTAELNKENVLGIITELGGYTSHTAIIARSLGIPAVIGATELFANLQQGDFLALDGENGEYYLNPDQVILTAFRQREQHFSKNISDLQEQIGKRSLTKDGHQVELACNIANIADLQAVLANDAEGVGLFRTEFIYMNREIAPTEEEQFLIYKAAAEKLAGKPVVIRTLDVGGDKNIPYLDFPEEENPFLGYRAIRVCLEHRELFKTQLRAILRASSYGNVKIMFPMIATVEEILLTKEILLEARGELVEKQVKFNTEIEVGVMIEVPSAAIISDLLAKEVDFFSIGTNDLAQYTLAIDRLNQKVAYLNSPFNPAALRLIKQIIGNAHNAGIWVGMCGELAGNLQLLPVLLGMGLDEFSMSPQFILRTRAALNRLSKEELAAQIDALLKLPTAKAVEEYIDENMLK